MLLYLNVGDQTEWIFYFRLTRTTLQKTHHRDEALHEI
jgi:hypothetical protein